MTQTSSPPHAPEAATSTAPVANPDATRRPVVLVTGATGKIGGELVKILAQDESIDLRAAVRKPEQAAAFANQGIRSVHLDLDDYDEFTAALAGVDRLFLIAGYTVDMLAQGKNVVDSAKAAGVRHIAHLGTFTQPGRPMGRYVGHMIWHQLLESYIEASSLGYTHLRPNVFMQSILGALDGDTYRGNWGPGAVGWVDGADIARVAAHVLRDPEPHTGATYYLSSEAGSEEDIALMLSQELGRPIGYEPVPLTDLLSHPRMARAEPAYARCIEQTVTLFREGTLTDIADVVDDVFTVTGVKATGLRDFIRRHRDALAG